MRDRFEREFLLAKREPRFSEENIERMRQVLSQRAGSELTCEEAEKGMSKLVGFCRLLAEIDHRNKRRAAEEADGHAAGQVSTGASSC